MFSSFQAIVLALSIVGATSASPLTSRHTKPTGSCRPKTHGANLAVINEAFATFATPVPSYLFHFTGEPNNTYVIKPIGIPGQAVVVTDLSSGSIVGTAEVDHKLEDPTQLWNVLCDECGPALNSNGCTISLAANGLCAQLDTTQTLPLFVAPCTGAKDQKWDLMSA